MSLPTFWGIGAWAGGTDGVNFVLLNKIVCFVLCVTSFPFVIFPLKCFVSHHSYLCGVEVHHTRTH